MLELVGSAFVGPLWAHSHAVPGMVPSRAAVESVSINGCFALRRSSDAYVGPPSGNVQERMLALRGGMPADVIWSQHTSWNVL